MEEENKDITLFGYDDYSKEFEMLEQLEKHQEKEKPKKKTTPAPKRENSRKGVLTTSDYIHFDKAMRVGERLLKDEKKRVLGLYIIVAINTGLRVSDILNLKWSHLTDNTRGFILVTEKKTKKQRKIQLNENILNAVAGFKKQNSDSFIFKSQKGSVFTIQQINRLLKTAFEKEAKENNISSHSLRKTFGRRVFEKYGESEKALVDLSDCFSHSSIAITRRYLGIRQEEIDDIYMNL
jgi:integrase